MPTLKIVKSLCHRFLRGAPQTLRLRYRLPSSSPEPFSILVFSSVHRSRLRYRPPSSFPKPSSVPSPSFVLHPRLRNCSPFSFSALFTGFVSGTVLRPVSVTVLHPRLRGYVLTTRRQTLRRCRCFFLVNCFQDDTFSAICK